MLGEIRDASTPSEPKNANIPRFKTRDKMHDGRTAQIRRGQIEHDWPSHEKSRRMSKRLVDLREPAGNRHNRTEHERDVGPATDAYRLPLLHRL